jgi:hypothetical protein
MKRANLLTNGDRLETLGEWISTRLLQSLPINFAIPSLTLRVTHGTDSWNRLSRSAMRQDE